MLYNVLTSLASDIGYHPVQQRSALIELLFRASKDMYNMLECNKIMREVTLVVPPDSVVALPSFIGELRGMRMHTNELPFDLKSIGSPRYTNLTLEFKYKNWRDLGDSAIQTKPTNVGPLRFVAGHEETTPCVVKVVGQTSVANCVEEEVTLDFTALTGNSVSSINSFGPRIDNISCFTERTCDIHIYDSTGVEIAILYNDLMKTRYKLIDVSQVFWTLDTADGGSLIDVCYKVPFKKLINDSDSFQAGDDYDNAWYWLAMHKHLSVLQGRETEAAAAYKEFVSAVQSAKDGSEQQIVKKVIFGRNKFYNIFKKYRYHPGSVTNVDHNTQT